MTMAKEKLERGNVMLNVETIDYSTI